MASTESKKQKKRKHTLSDLKTLGHQLLSSRAHINNLPLLLTFVTPSSPPQYVLESILSLQAFFASVFPELPSDTASYKKSFVHSQAEVDPEFIYKAWLRAKFDEFVKSLIEIAVCPQSEETLREVIMDTIMEFVKLGNRGRFNSALYHRLLCSVVHSVFKENLLLDLLASKYFKYIDVRYFTYVSLEHIIKTLETGETSGKEADGLEGNDENHLKSREEIYVHKIWTTLLHIPPHEKSSGHEMWSESGASQKEEYSEALKADVEQPKEHRSNSNGISAASISKKMKLKFTKAWFAFLRLPLPLDVYKEVLATLHQAVIPYLSNPIMLCDFLIKSYDIGGVISIMALSSLYVLMTQHGLEYPNFYEKLYVLLVPSIFLAKYRAKFFQLLDSCLKSPLIPAYMAAAFAKKLSRLALSVPPSGALVIISLIHNLLRRHPSISCLVHREDSDETAKDDASPKKVGGDETLCTKRGIDQFSNEEIDLVKTKAMLSSLWEIDTLRHHYCPPVSRFVLSLEDDLTVRSKTTEIAVKDFSSGSYSTIFGNEIRRRVKQVPLAFYRATPTSLFSEVDFPGWTFKYEDSNEKNGETKHEDLPFPDEHKSSSAKRQRVECS